MFSLLLLLLIIFVNQHTELISYGLLWQGNSKDVDFTIMTYNVHNAGKDYAENQVAIAKEILNMYPDVAYLCEFALWRNRKLDSIVTFNNAYTRYYITGTNCVFYSKYAIDTIADVFAVVSKKKHSLNNKIHVFLGNDTLTLIGCHFSSSNHHIRKGYQKREKEADAIYESIKDEKYPVIVMGDLNDISGSYAVERVKEAGLKDAWWEGGLGYGATFHDKWLRLRLDHILYQNNKLDLNYIKVIDSDLSDHNALVAGFTFKK